MNKDAVLLVNLGSPKSPSTGDVRAYLREFLMDERVIDMQWLARFALVHGCILPFRPSRSAEAYRKIWTAEGSPLIVTSRKLQIELQRCIGLPVELAMRYGEPSIKQAIQNLRRQQIQNLFLIPLFPHYAMSSFETAVERVREVLNEVAPDMRLDVARPYYNQPEYIRALVASASDALQSGYDHLLFSFHGIPERHLHKTDLTGCHCLKSHDCCSIPSPVHARCYRAQCFKTAYSFAEESGISEKTFSIAFQSRLGRDAWLTPSTQSELERLAKSGVKKLAVICPAFVSDCLETLEEIGLRGREAFLSAGGQSFELIPCLNTHPLWMHSLAKMVFDWKREL